MEFQTRNDDGELRQFDTFAGARAHADKDRTVWKISFTIAETSERIRLIRYDANTFIYEDVDGTR